VQGEEGEAARRRLRALLGDLTFMEAFQRTGGAPWGLCGLWVADGSSGPRGLRLLRKIQASLRLRPCPAVRQRQTEWG
jgi:hypothetical protein